MPPIRNMIKKINPILKHNPKNGKPNPGMYGPYSWPLNWGTMGSASATSPLDSNEPAW
jgi:hypothetical protein